MQNVDQIIYSKQPILLNRIHCETGLEIQDRQLAKIIQDSQRSDHVSNQAEIRASFADIKTTLQLDHKQQRQTKRRATRRYKRQH